MGPNVMSQPPAEIADVPDAELLRRYLAGRDDAALAALVGRHGGMVLSVCRRILANLHDADDAFQATFLVFVRKTASVRPGALVGPYLHGIATRTALKARALAARRRAREKQVEALPDVAAPAGPATADWLPLLDREVAALPAKYRLPVLLCDLQGLSRSDVAGQLGVPEGTLSSRLNRARTLLRRRLSKRGAGAAVLVAAVLFPTATRAAPPALVQTTVQAASAFAARAALTTPPALLARAVLASLRRMQLAVIAAAILSLAVLGGGGFLIVRSSQPTLAAMIAADREHLQGDWAVSEATEDGKAADAWTLQTLSYHFRGDEVNLPFDSKYTIDPTMKPKQIDLVCELLGPPNNCMLGIYEVSGDDLTLCLGAPGRDRPTAFAAEPGSGRTPMILKRRHPAQ